MSPSIFSFVRFFPLQAPSLRAAEAVDLPKRSDAPPLSDELALLPLEPLKVALDLLPGSPLIALLRAGLGCRPGPFFSVALRHGFVPLCAERPLYRAASSAAE